MGRLKKRTGAEWLGGLVSMPAYVTGEADRDPYRPELLVWMGEDGALLGWALERPGELLPQAGEHLRATMEKPMIGRAHAPARVRVASRELADVLRAAHPSLEIVCAPTPELDAVVEHLREHLGDGSSTEPTYLSGAISADAIAAFFRAAADLFRAEPWKVVPSDHDLFSVSIEKLGVNDAVMSVIGQMGTSFGLVLFAGVDDFEGYGDAAAALERGEDADVPPHFAINFERGEDLPPGLRKEIAEHGWEVAGPTAYPWPTVADEGLVARPLAADEVTIAEALALALPKVLVERSALEAAWSGGAPVLRTLSVRTHAGELAVTLRAPYAEGRSMERPPSDVLRDLFDLANEGAEIDPAERRRLEDELVALFVESPEGRSVDDAQPAQFVMDFAADYFGATIATLDASALREIVFDITPRKVSIDASEAAWIVDGVRAFYAFLKRELGLAQADACLRVVGDGAVRKLEAALSDPAKFGMAKSFFMAGRDAGFDMTSQDGLDAWVRAANSGGLPPSVRIPSIGGASRAADSPEARKRKHQRKAARKARKKNR